MAPVTHKITQKTKPDGTASEAVPSQSAWTQRRITQ